MTPAPCIYLSAAAEAASIAPDGTEVEAAVCLCTWPDMHPERFVDAPMWLLRLVGPGLAIDPERNCVGCPAYRAVGAAHV